MTTAERAKLLKFLNLALFNSNHAEALSACHQFYKRLDAAGMTFRGSDFDLTLEQHAKIYCMHQDGKVPSDEYTKELADRVRRNRAEKAKKEQQGKQQQQSHQQGEYQYQGKQQKQKRQQ